jgi:hypothetical protein
MRQIFAILASLAACQERSGTVLHGGPDACGGTSGDGGACATPPWFPNTGAEPSWVTGSCPAAGCPLGTTCVRASIAAAIVQLGCAPIPASCGGNPLCSCMGCVCGGTSTCDTQTLHTGILCDTGTVSRRSAKDDVVYVGSDERAALAREALAIPLARYRYKGEPSDARRRLGFVIDDQPDPSPAVHADRMHVDEYGYTSMLLATVQQQAREISELRRRLEQLERADARRRGK